jgi:hypothetical protein
VNCAHDHPEIWRKVIHTNLFLLSAVRDPMLSSDGSGRPKEGPHTATLEKRMLNIVKIRLAEDSIGNVITPAHVWWLSRAVTVTTKPSRCRTFLIPLLFLCYQRTKKVEEAFTW